MRATTSGRRLSLYGAGLGLLWGAVLRLWMRYIAATPEFTTAGTTFILGASLVVGAVLAWARYRSMLEGRGLWRLSILSLGLLGAGGGVMWPSVILGAAAIGRRRPRWLLTILTVAALAFQVPVMQEAVFEAWWLDNLEMTVAVGWYAAMITAQAWAFSIVFIPLEPSPTVSRGSKASWPSTFP